MPHVSDSLKSMNDALGTLQSSVDALLTSRSGLTSAEIEARIQTAVQAAIDAVLAELENYDAATVLARLDQIKQIFDILNSVGDERYFYEFFRAPFTAVDATLKVAVTKTVVGDNSIDVADTSSLVEGETYVIYDEDGTVEVVEVLEILTATRFLAGTNMVKTRTNAGTLFRTSWDLSTAGKAVVGNGAYYSVSISTVLAADSSGRLLIRRDGIDGTLAPYARTITNGEPGTWEKCAYVSSMAVNATTADVLYTIPVGGVVQIRVDSAKGLSGAAFNVLYMVAMTPFRAARADSVRQPTITSPANGATGISTSTPSIVGNTYYSLYGVAQAAMELQVATDANFSNTVYSGTGGAVTTLAVAAGTLATNTAYFARIRYKDSEGTYSPWSATVGFSTGAVFQYLTVPSITAPAAGATRVALQPTITLSAFAPVGVADTHVASQYQIATDSAFTNIVYNSGDSANLLSHIVPPANTLSRLINYYMRARQKGQTLGYSGWSSTIAFQTINGADAPTITSPIDGATSVLLPMTIAVSAFSFPGGGEAHVATQYQVATGVSFASIVFDSGDSANLVSYTIPRGNLSTKTEYYVRARQKGATTGYSPWSSAVHFTTQEPSGEQIFTSPGSYDFTVPENVTSICVVCVGGSGSEAGGGGALRYKNNIAVNPGVKLPVVVGGIAGSSSFGSYVTAGGGATGSGSGTAAGGIGYGGDGGGDGGQGGSGYGPGKRDGGGGGAGGYAGNGGNGGEGTGTQSGVGSNGTAGTGGGGGGGAGGGFEGGGGGGVGLSGQGLDGAGGVGCFNTGNGYTYGNGGGGGSGGTNGLVGSSGGIGGAYGGGAGGGGHNGNPGAVRIIWGPNRSFPSMAA